MKNTIITIASIATLAVSANAQTWGSTVSNNFGATATELANITGPADAGGPPAYWADMSSGEFATYDFGVAGIDTTLSIVLWEATGSGINAVEFAGIDIFLSNDGINFTSIKGTESAGFLVGGEIGNVEIKDSRSYDGSAFGATARYLKVESSGGGGFDLNAVAVNATAVPEPSSTALLGLGALGLLVRRKR